MSPYREGIEVFLSGDSPMKMSWLDCSVEVHHLKFSASFQVSAHRCRHSCVHILLVSAMTSRGFRVDHEGESTRYRSIDLAKVHQSREIGAWSEKHRDED